MELFLNSLESSRRVVSPRSSWELHLNSELRKSPWNSPWSVVIRAGHLPTTRHLLHPVKFAAPPTLPTPNEQSLSLSTLRFPDLGDFVCKLPFEHRRVELVRQSVNCYSSIQVGDWVHAEFPLQKWRYPLGIDPFLASKHLTSFWASQLNSLLARLFRSLILEVVTAASFLLLRIV